MTNVFQLLERGSYTYVVCSAED